MNMRRAFQINYWLVGYGLSHVMGDPSLLRNEGRLRELTLLEMVTATQLVRSADLPEINGARSLTTKCDERLIAAIYASLHYTPQLPGRPEPAFVGNGCGVFVIRVPWPEEGEEVSDG